MANDDLIAREADLAARSHAVLQALAGTILPADPDLGVPAGDDPAILADAIAVLVNARAHAAVNTLVDTLDALAEGDFLAMAEPQRLVIAERLRASRARPVPVVYGALIQAYYRDDRVMTSLGMEPRAPFPIGYSVPDGNWALLDPVRAREPLWRKA